MKLEVCAVSVVILNVIYTDAYSIATSKCPCSKENWEERESKFYCDKKKYTCILDNSGKLVETCIFSYTIAPQEVGCPFVRMDPDKGALLGFPYSKCNVSGCPLPGHESYGINEIYKYPMCWVPEENRIPFSKKSSTVIMCADNENVSPTTSSRNVMGSSHIAIIVGLSLIIVILFPLVVFLIVWRKRARPYCVSKDKKDQSSLGTDKFTNYATGLAWSHYTGYLRILLPALEQAIQDSDTFKAHPEQTYNTWVMLCPSSATSKSLSETSSIKKSETISIPGTTFKVNMYEIVTDRGSLYCCMEYPSALMSLGSGFDIIGEQEKALEVERFAYYIMNILNHECNEGCKGKAVALFYDEQMTTVRDEMISKVFNKRKEQLPKEVTICFLKPGEGKHPMEKTIMKMEKSFPDNAVLGVNLQTDDQNIILAAFSKANWIVMSDIVSPNQSLLERLKQLVREGQIKIICLFAKGRAGKLIKDAPSAVCVDMKKEKYAVDQIKKIVMGFPIVKSSHIILGDIAFGLSCSFFVNYLKHVLPDLHQRLESAVESHISEMKLERKNVRVSKCLWEIVPNSCTFKELSEFDALIKGPITVKALQKNVHETNRVYPARMFSFMKGGITYFFLGEVFSPCKVLKAMQNSSLVALSKTQFNQLRKNCIKQMRSLLLIMTNKHNSLVQTKLLSFNDKGKQSLSDMMHSLLKKEEQPALETADSFGESDPLMNLESQ